MPLRAIGHVERHFGGDLSGVRVVLFGVTYRPGVADTRSSPTEIVARALRSAGAEVVAYDPLVETWEELPDVATLSDPREAVEGADAVVICLPDGHYREFLADLLLEKLQAGAIVVDPWNMVAEACDAPFAERGVALEVYGRGDVGGPARRRLRDREAE